MQRGVPRYAYPELNDLKGKPWWGSGEILHVLPFRSFNSRFGTPPYTFTICSFVLPTFLCNGIFVETSEGEARGEKEGRKRGYTVEIQEGEKVFPEV